MKLSQLSIAEKLDAGGILGVLDFQEPRGIAADQTAFQLPAAAEARERALRG